jgi:hypothetical protein
MRVISKTIWNPTEATMMAQFPLGTALTNLSDTDRLYKKSLFCRYSLGLYVPGSSLAFTILRIAHSINHAVAPKNYPNFCTAYKKHSASPYTTTPQDVYHYCHPDIRSPYLHQPGSLIRSSGSGHNVTVLLPGTCRWLEAIQLRRRSS